MVLDVVEMPCSINPCSRDLAAQFARVSLFSFALGNQRAQGMPDARCTRGLVCKHAQRKRTRAYRFSGGNPTFPAQWFYGFLRALPGDRAFLSPSPAEIFSANLTPASGRQDHTSIILRTVKGVESNKTL